MIGLSASVRLNGLLLVPVFSIAYLTAQASGLGGWRRRLAQPQIWAALGAVFAVMVALQPYLLFSPTL